MPITPQLEKVRKATQWKPGQSGNPAGKPLGVKHLSTWIKELTNDETFEANILDAKKGVVEYKGAPIKAIITVAITKAVNGDDKAREWIGKYYGDAQKVEHSGEINKLSDEELDAIIARASKASPDS